MFQEIDPNKISFDETRRPASNDYVVSVKYGKVLFKKTNDEIDIPLVSDFEDIDLNGLKHLMSVDDSNFYMSMEYISAPDMEYGKLIGLLHLDSIPQEIRFAACTCAHLAGWYEDNKLCGRCGTLTQYGKERNELVCPECGRHIFPTIAPVVIVGITNGDKLMLTRYAAKGAYAHHSLVAGFVEVGETLEEAIRREACEETGLKVKNIRYFASQPWAFSSALLMGFWAEADGTEVHLNADGKGELATAEWISRDDIKMESDESSLTWTMIKKFKDNEK